MKRTWITLGAVGLFGFAAQAQALSVNANATEDAVSIQASQSILPTVQAGVGYLNSDDRSGGIDVYSAHVLFTPPVPGVDLGVGAQYQYQDARYGDGGGLGLGGHLYVPTPLPRVDVGGYGFYTPDGLTHGDIDSSYEAGVRARAGLTDNLYGYVGYRYLRTDFDDGGSQTLDKGLMFGVSLGF